MSQFARTRRPKSPAAKPIAEQPVAKPPAAAFSIGEQTWFLSMRVLLPAFRVGDYEVGEGFCPRLCGHPGIRY